MRFIRPALLLLAASVLAACNRYGQIQNLPLSWQGNTSPAPSPWVAQAFAYTPFAFGLRDVRPDPYSVGQYADGWVVRTSDNVGQYCSARLGEMLTRAGARLGEQPTANLDVDLLEYHVAEGGTFNATVRINATLRRGEAAVWQRTYVGTSKSWGKTHNPSNYNKTLSAALADVAGQMVRDDDFARALMPAPPGPQPGPPPPPAPGPPGG